MKKHLLTFSLLCLTSTAFANYNSNSNYNPIDRYRFVNKSDAEAKAMIKTPTIENYVVKAGHLTHWHDLGYYTTGTFYPHWYFDNGVHVPCEPISNTVSGQKYTMTLQGGRGNYYCVTQRGYSAS